jgi:hypothetical protein
VFLADLDRVRNSAVSGLCMDLVSINSSPASLVSPSAATISLPWHHACFSSRM